MVFILDSPVKWKTAVCGQSINGAGTIQGGELGESKVEPDPSCCGFILVFPGALGSLGGSIIDLGSLGVLAVRLLSCFSWRFEFV
jgi:hypothetical protein